MQICLDSQVHRRGVALVYCPAHHLYLIILVYYRTLPNLTCDMLLNILLFRVYTLSLLKIYIYLMTVYEAGIYLSGYLFIYLSGYLYLTYYCMLCNIHFDNVRDSSGPGNSGRGRKWTGQ